MTELTYLLFLFLRFSLIFFYFSLWSFSFFFFVLLLTLPFPFLFYFFFLPFLFLFLLVLALVFAFHQLSIIHHHHLSKRIKQVSNWMNISLVGIGIIQLLTWSTRQRVIFLPPSLVQRRLVTPSLSPPLPPLRAVASSGVIVTAHADVQVHDVRLPILTMPPPTISKQSWPSITIRIGTYR